MCKMTPVIQPYNGNGPAPPGMSVRMRTNNLLFCICITRNQANDYIDERHTDEYDPGYKRNRKQECSLVQGQH
jgi:hypothetical protein